jgi:hypothetical protein
MVTGAPVVMFTAKSVKLVLSITLDPAAFAAGVKPPAAGDPKISAVVETGGKQFKVELKPKAVTKALKLIELHGAEAIVLRLEGTPAGGRIDNPALLAVVKSADFKSAGSCRSPRPR